MIRLQTVVAGIKILTSNQTRFYVTVRTADAIYCFKGSNGMQYDVEETLFDMSR